MLVYEYLPRPPFPAILFYTFKYATLSGEEGNILEVFPPALDWQCFTVWLSNAHWLLGPHNKLHVEIEDGKYGVGKSYHLLPLQVFFKSSFFSNLVT